MEEENQKLREDIILLKGELEELKEKLKKYTAPVRSKKYYENHKEEIKEKHKEYRETIDKDKKAEYNKRYYLKKKSLKENEMKEV